MAQGISHQCEFVKSSGSRCRAAARTGTTHCWFHEPSLTRERPRKRGGIARSHRAVTLPADAPLRPLASLADVLVLLEEATNAVRLGALEPRLANCVGYLCSIAVSALSQGTSSGAGSVSFVVVGPVPCPQCKTERGKECTECHGMGWVRAPKENLSAASQT
jgi:hypothetical protein